MFDVGDLRESGPMKPPQSSAFKFVNLTSNLVFPPPFYHRFNISVVAQNHVSFVKSPNVTVNIVERISKVLGIKVHGDVIIGKKLKISVTHAFGSEVTYEWDFGDEKSLRKTTLPFINHIYYR